MNHSNSRLMSLTRDPDQATPFAFAEARDHCHLLNHGSFEILCPSNDTYEFRVPEKSSSRIHAKPIKTCRRNLHFHPRCLAYDGATSPLLLQRPAITAIGESGSGSTISLGAKAASEEQCSSTVGPKSSTHASRVPMQMRHDVLSQR